jgi:hypothetical protein|tara:strand:+ start:83 stop:1039 length:957 start_codon:yes stop_codon:yes gene_type:complete
LAKRIPPIVKIIRNFKPEPINFGFQKNISYSQLSMFRSCPKKWALHYKDGHKKHTPSIHMVFGTAFHEVMQHYLDVMYDKSGAAADRENIKELLEDKIREEYLIQYKKNNNQHFSSSEEIREFFEDGMKILEYFKKNKGTYFKTKGWFLVGCEIPISVIPNNAYKNVIYNGFLDVVMYHEPTDKFQIIDIKTSTKGWNSYAKKDEEKLIQLILYKKYFAEQFGLAEESIDIEYIIAKRKVPEDAEFASMKQRIQNFQPPSKSKHIKEATKKLKKFINEAFDYNGYKETFHVPRPSKWNCHFCAFKEDDKLCNVLGKNL